MSRPLAALSTAELRVLRLVAKGLPNAAIARKLHIAEQTVKYHLTNTYRKLGVTNRTEAVLLLLKDEAA